MTTLQACEIVAIPTHTTVKTHKRRIKPKTGVVKPRPVVDESKPFFIEERAPSNTRRMLCKLGVHAWQFDRVVAPSLAKAIRYKCVCGAVRYRRVD